MSFRDLLECGDVDGLRAYWHHHAPNMPQPKSRDQTEIVMHRARTEAASVSPRARSYSHAWLRERSLPSGLPDEMKPHADRMYPVTVLAVGISVNARSPWMQPAMIEVRGAMEHAVLDAEVDGRLADAPFVKARMDEARQRTMRALFGQ